MTNPLEPTSRTTDTRSPLRRLFTSRSFVALFVSNALGFGGEQMRFAVQSWWILDEGGSKTEMGLAAGLRIIPVLVITLIAGVMIDRFGGKRILLLERVLLVVLALITAFVLLSGNTQIWHIIVLSTLAGTTIALGMPATQTLVPEVVPEELRQSANSLNQFGYSVGRSLGPLLGGILIAARDAALAFFGLVVVYAVSLVATFGISVKGQTKPVSSDSALRQIIDGLAYVRRTPVIFWVILVSIALTFFSMLFPIVPVYAREVLNVDEVKFGWMWGALAMGQASSALTIAALGGFRDKKLGLIAGAGLFGIGIVAFGLSETYWLSLIFLAVAGAGIPLWMSSVLTLLQDHSAPEYRGRVMAVYAISLQGVSVGWMLGGFLLDQIGNFPTVLVSVGGGWAILLVSLASSKDLRNAK